ncbi:MAG: two-component regulator propeller domain-containing protein [Verrucomicrobiia bacterium]
MKKLRARATTLTFVLLVALNGSIFAGSPHALGDSGYFLRTWDTDDGLPENSATAIAQTRDGYLWVGTFNGLVRYNGDGFRVFDRTNTPQLPGAEIVNLFADQRDRLWISTLAGLALKDGANWSLVGTNEGWAGNYVRTVAERANGDLLMTTFDGHVMTLENNRLTELPAPPGEPGRGYLGTVDEEGHWWLAQNRFVGHWNGQRWVQVHTPSPAVGRSAVACAPARGGGVWVLLAKELLRFRGGSEVSRLALPQIKGGFWSMSEDSQTNLWICSYDSGLFQLTRGGNLRHWTTSNGLGPLSTRMVFEDREANLWIGSSGGGLRQLTPRRFLELDGASQVLGKVARSVALAGDGSIWMAFYDAGLFRRTEMGVVRVLVPGPNNESAYGLSVLEDRAGRLWYGDVDNCWLRRSPELSFEKVPIKPSPGANVSALFEDSKGHIWIGTRDGAVVYDGSTLQQVAPKTGLPSGQIMSFGEDTSGALWVAGADGVFRQEGDQFTAVLDDNDQPLRGALCLKADADGSMWIGMSVAGLVRWRSGRIDRIGPEHALPQAEVRGFIEDNHGYFWMPSNRGIIRAHRTQLHAVTDGAVRKFEYQLLGRNDGLPSSECFVAQSNCAKDGAGRLWFATQKGVAVIDPARFRLNSAPPLVQVEQVVYHLATAKAKAKEHPGARRSADTEVRLVGPFDSPLQLPPGAYGLDFEFAALTFTAPEKVRFQYQLEGATRDWEEAGNERSVRFHQLPPGKYVLRVRAANNDGVWSETGASLALTMLPHFWQAGWFRLGMVLLLFALGGTTVWSWSRHRIARALERERVAHEVQQLRLQLWHADRVAQTGVITGSLAHELNQPLTGILSTAQAGLRFLAGGNPDPALVHEVLSNIVHDTKRAGAVINGLRAMLRRKETQREPISLADTVREILGLLHSELVGRQVEHRLRVESDAQVLCDKAQIQQVLLNLIMNALEAMQEQPPERRRLELTVERTATGEAIVAVRDSGPGIPQDRQEKLFMTFWTTKPQGMGIGLSISYAIVESHGGRLWCTNNPDGGAIFYFTLPLAPPVPSSRRDPSPTFAPETA